MYQIFHHDQLHSLIMGLCTWFCKHLKRTTRMTYSLLLGTHMYISKTIFFNPWPPSRPPPPSHCNTSLLWVPAIWPSKQTPQAKMGEVRCEAAMRSICPGWQPQLSNKWLSSGVTLTAKQLRHDFMSIAAGCSESPSPAQWSLTKSVEWLERHVPTNFFIPVQKQSVVQIPQPIQQAKERVVPLISSQPPAYLILTPLFISQQQNSQQPPPAQNSLQPTLAIPVPLSSDRQKTWNSLHSLPQYTRQLH